MQVTAPDVHRARESCQPRTLFAVLLLSLLAGCGSETLAPLGRIDGAWGAEGIDLVASPDSALVEYDCAHGTIAGALSFDENMRFTRSGTHVFEGGPVREDNPPEVHPARFEGQAVGARLRLTVVLTQSGTVIGPYVLSRGVPGTLRKCL